MTRLATFAALLLLGLLLAAAAAWGTAALLFAGPPKLQQALAAAFGLASVLLLAGLASPRWRWRSLAVLALLLAAVLAWWLNLAPSNQRQWQPDVAQLPRAVIDGDLVTVHNVRNIAYRSETDFTPAYETRQYDLRKLEGVDVVATYWMGPAIAHIFLSFVFTEGEPLAVSIETRKEVGEDYSTVKGFFRQYELHYVVADERDLIRLRTNFRHNPPEQVYVYRATGSQAGVRQLFLDYLAKINALNAQPEFYNTLTTNCTTNIWLHSLVNPGHVPFSWKILASGYVPQYLYEQGRLQTRGLPFDELQRQALVNPRAQQAGDAADFSRRIRQAAVPAP